ncbi:MAG: GNAT family N-acetyltransferase [Holosporales bacterium]
MSDVIWPLEIENYKMRLLRQADADVVQTLLDACQDYFMLCEGEPGMAQALFMACPPQKSHDEDKVVLGLFHQDQVIGMIDLIRDYPEDGTWTIGYLLIHSNYRNLGLGQKWVRQMATILKDLGAQKLRCVVQQQNPRALHFWQQLGFAVQASQRQDLGTIINQVDVLEISF